jgi:hypothetical protein
LRAQEGGHLNEFGYPIYQILSLRRGHGHLSEWGLTERQGNPEVSSGETRINPTTARKGGWEP